MKPSADEAVKHKLYKGQDIRSSPRQLGNGVWRIRIDVTFPGGNGRDRIVEYLDEEHDYLTLNEAHDAGFQYACSIIDEQPAKHTMKS